MMQMPYGYLKTVDGRRLSDENMANLSKMWKEAFSGPVFRIPFLDGVEFVPFPNPPIPDAICLHCGRANLHSAYQCLGCNAPLVREGKP